LDRGQPLDRVTGVDTPSGTSPNRRTRFHGESYGWEVQFFERGEFFGGRGAFATRTLAIQFAEEERKGV